MKRSKIKGPSVMDVKIKAECKRYGSTQVRRAFVILKQPGRIPEKKGAFLTEEHLEKFVRECIEAYPQREVTIAVCRLTWNDDLWVDDGREMIGIIDSFKPRRRKKAHA